MREERILAMTRITKTFPGVTALDDVSFDLKKGEIHGLVGENGAGKSTLIKILGGVYLPDHGDIDINGERQDFHSPRDALHRGISVIYQEFNLVPTLTVAENIFLGKELVRPGMRDINRKEMVRRANATMETLGLTGFDCNQEVRNLSVAQQQMVEIGKALFNDAAILVMDEPTSVLSQKESHTLFELMDGLRRKGISIIFISHRLDEVIEMSDRITVLRDGEYVCTLENQQREISKDDLIRYMVGRVLQDYFPEKMNKPGSEKILEVKGLTSPGLFEDISFDLFKGEILGFYGLVGSGRTEIMKGIFSHLEVEEGEILINGVPSDIKTVKDARNLGMALVPEDRKREGLVMKMTLGENISLPNLDKVSSAGTILFKKRKELVNRYMKSLSIRPSLPNRLISNFSGGNQQKAVISKWLASRPKIIIFDEPTRGIDVGAKAEIYQLIAGLAAEGVAIILVSSELMEIIGMCDRVVVIHEGSVTGIFDSSEATEERLMQAAAGF